MVVTSQCCGHKVTGILIGESNARRYFPRNITEIELQLDHLRIECGLGPEFWNGNPVISDPRLSLWLESKEHRYQGWHDPVPMALIPSGENSFILDPANHENVQEQTH